MLNQPTQEKLRTRIVAGFLGLTGISATATALLNGNRGLPGVAIVEFAVLLYVAVTGRSLVLKQERGDEELRAALGARASEEVLSLVRAGQPILAIRQQRAETGDSLTKAKRLIDQLILQNTCFAEFPAAPAPVLHAIRRGRKIEAIRLYREVTGFGLAEAKAAIEHYELHHRLGSLSHHLPPSTAIRMAAQRGAAEPSRSVATPPA